MAYEIDNTDVVAHDARIAQAKQFLAANKTYLGRGVNGVAAPTTAQNTAQIKLLSQAVGLLVKHVMNEEQ